MGSRFADMIESVAGQLLERGGRAHAVQGDVSKPEDAQGSEAGFWYFYYLLAERGRAGRSANPQGSYDVVERRLTHAPPIDVPTITLEGLADNDFPPTQNTWSRDQVAWRTRDGGTSR